MIALTLLYAPGDRPELVAKALASTADVVIVDLEDAVAPGRKNAARETLDMVAAACPRPVQVRINASTTPWFGDDAEALRELPSWVEARVPKIDSADDVAAIRALVGGRALHALLETPLAVENAFAIASAGVASVGLGESDLTGALGVATVEHLQWQRSRVINAAAAAGLEAPSMSVFPSVSDLDGLRESCRMGKAMGFCGRAAIHPRQLPVIEEAFLPTAMELERAQGVLDGFAASAAGDQGTCVLPDGQFIDIAMIRQARRVVELGRRA